MDFLQCAASDDRIVQGWLRWVPTKPFIFVSTSPKLKKTQSITVEIILDPFGADGYQGPGR